ncbi:MAG: Ig-like domain-containing protein [Kofleriaceae bacterium]
MYTVLRRLVPLALAVLFVACTGTASTTDLNPEGPPMIRQVLMDENVITDPGNPGATDERRVFAFGSHPLATAEQVREVTHAAVQMQTFRIVIDELLRGNNLEEVECRGIVDDDVFDRVPVKADPDDISRCAAPNDVLPRTCAVDARAICICKNEGGCARETDIVGIGEPVGIKDLNEDGGADNTRLIAGSVGIVCDEALVVPINLEASYWNPSGDQNKPAEGGFEALGPAIVLAPDGPMPTSASCQLAFAAEVVDKQDVPVCAPPGGDITQSCTPGDVSAFTFRSEAMLITPLGFNDGQLPFDDGQTMVDRTVTNAQLLANTTLAPGSLANITMTRNGAPFTAFTVTSPMAGIIQINFTGALAANTAYVITIPTTVTDTFGKGLVAPLEYDFMTGP